MDSYIRHLVRKWLVAPSVHLAQQIANAVTRIEADDRPPGYLAVGVSMDENYTMSRLVHTTDARAVYEFLSAEAEHADYMTNDEIWGEILLIENGPDCPNVIRHWNWKDWATG